MEILSAQSISFSYPDAKEHALSDNSFSVRNGEFLVLSGPSGSGKSTLLKMIKHDIAPHGIKSGKIFYKGTDLEELTPLTRAKQIGMVFQDPDNQIVMDNVMDELLFGLQNLGFPTPVMRKKVAEMVHFFNLNHLLTKHTHNLSGGEKQLVNLASVLLLEPDVLLLDEPTGQLDPIAAKEFIHTIERLNDEFGITVIIAEHRLEELFTIADKVMVLQNGRITHFDETKHVVNTLVREDYLQAYLPTTARLFLTYQPNSNPAYVPLNVKDTREWLNGRDFAEYETAPDENAATEMTEKQRDEVILKLKEVDFQYEAHTPPVLHHLSISIARGEWHAILGANGTGKSTLVKVICGILKPQHGTITYNGKKQKKIRPGEIGYLPQDPALFFVQDTIMKEYQSIGENFNIKNVEARIDMLLTQFGMHPFKDRHPYDLSGGQLQKAALIGALLINPSLLLIDEPTKGLDPDFKEELATILQTLIDDGLTILMVTHDVEFAATHATTCSMVFQGQITVTEDTDSFFKKNMYYTTVMNRIIRNMNVPPVITLQEAISKWRIPTNT